MKYHIKAKALNKKVKIRIFLRWLCYALVFILFYMIMCSGAFKTWQPLLIIPLAVAVAMKERELSSCVFGAVCGLMLDIGTGGLFGFYAIWLLPCCLVVSLLVMNLIRVNLVNHLWLTASTTTLLLLINYLFKYVIWELPNVEVIFFNIIFPSLISTILLSVPVYLLITLIYNKLSYKEQLNISSSVPEPSEEGDK